MTSRGLGDELICAARKSKGNVICSSIVLDKGVLGRTLANDAALVVLVWKRLTDSMRWLSIQIFLFGSRAGVTSDTSHTSMWKTPMSCRNTLRLEIGLVLRQPKRRAFSRERSSGVGSFMRRVIYSVTISSWFGRLHFGNAYRLVDEQAQDQVQEVV
jgi:hypothetical protein